ncbi:aldolase [Siculibacillus lacustris]|uniref:3-oxo-tetronate 4-phosphate decarboxylase n=1 Tax=Siculibacillus lacustris TaxID=1549641 RepID=A0A4Q9VSN8_9HYPH|nr:3-oxo-tetronate 4-phosphate decarboxylase [Siculibacillus lacustris]TBW39012.1 aldolase [Siculibacillus lacustris]
MTEAQLRDDLVRLAKSLFERGFSVGSAGNISVRVADGLLITPTNSCLGFLDADRISKLDRDGRHVAGDPPSKEVFLHRAFYETRPATGAVVHLHSTGATALSCLADVDADDCIPPLTPYVVMRVGTVKLLPYFRPGDASAGDLIRGLNGAHAAVLLANHGPVVAGADLRSTVQAAEELEETAKLLVLLQGQRVRLLSADQVQALRGAFGGPPTP